MRVEIRQKIESYEGEIRTKKREGDMKRAAMGTIRAIEQIIDAVDVAACGVKAEEV